MDITYAKELLEMLADGVNPITGEVLPESDSCNQPDIIRALHLAVAQAGSLRRMISAAKAGRCSVNGAMIPCSLFTTARIHTILCAGSEGIFLSEYLAQ